MILENNYISIHQPNYLPWAGYFFKICVSKTFVFLDDVQASKQSFFNRVKILENNKTNWLTVPMKISLGTKINEVKFSQDDWKKRHLSKIFNSYKKSNFFKEVFIFFENLYSSAIANNPSETNKFFIKKISHYLEIETNFLSSSDMKVNSDLISDDRLISILKFLKASLYLSGTGAASYQDQNKFIKNNIALNYMYNLNLNYTQSSIKFEPGLSIIDLLFNLGKIKTREYIRNNFAIK